ncbi:MAG TPA: NADH-quinone oxidoreductase subunit M, partial [Chloroflexi bacterium]|nr:NADH-quinone oxidoreductase subunit M [Chloroflexota bacterium]
ASIGLPGLSGFVGEYLAMQGAFREYYWAGAISMFVVILAAWYMMWLYQRVVFMRQPEDMPDPHDNELTPEEVLMLQRAGVGHGDAHGLPAVSGGSGDTAHAAEHGRISWHDLDTRELVAIVPLVILSIVLGVWPGVFMNVMQRSLEAALQAFGSIGI